MLSRQFPIRIAASLPRLAVDDPTLRHHLPSGHLCCPVCPARVGAARRRFNHIPKIPRAAVRLLRLNRRTGWMLETTRLARSRSRRARPGTSGIGVTPDLPVRWSAGPVQAPLPLPPADACTVNPRTGLPIIVVSPSIDAEGQQAYSGRGQLFDGRVDSRIIVKRSSTPFCDGARVLLAEACDPAARLVMRNDGSTVDA